MDVSENCLIFAAKLLNDSFGIMIDVIPTLFGNEAVLSNKYDLTSFKYGDYNIRFRTPAILKAYTEVKEWDNGYLVVMADYEGIGITEEYIDLVPILKNLYINPETFLKNIRTVRIAPYES